MKVLLAVFFLFLLGACSNRNLDDYRELFSLTCEGLNKCSADIDCDKTQGQVCFRDLCAKGPVCIKTTLACLGQCGRVDCGILESNPAQINCSKK